MSTSPLSLFRSTSPGFILPKSHSELMSLYKSWNTFSPKFKSKSYKKDAASLIISWIKIILKKQLWRWRRNISNSHLPSVQFTFKAKNPPSFTDRRVYLEVQFNRNLINRKISQKAKSPLPPSILNKTTRSVYLSIPNKKTTNSQNLKQKCKSAVQIGKLLLFLVKKQYMDVFFSMLWVARSYWVGKKMTRVLIKKVKSKLQGFFKELKNLSMMNSFEIFKVFVKQGARNVAKQESLNLSPRGMMRISKESQTNKTNSSSFLEISVQENQSRSNLSIELSPISRKIRRNLPFSHKNLTTLSIIVQSLIQNKRRQGLKILKSYADLHKNLGKFSQILKSLENKLKTRYFHLIKLKLAGLKMFHFLLQLKKRLFLQTIKTFKIFSHFSEKVLKALKIHENRSKLIKQKAFYRLRPSQISFKKVKNVGLVAYALKLFINNYLKTIFITIHEHSQSKKILLNQAKKARIETIYKILSQKVQQTKLFLLQKLQKRIKNLKFFSESLKTAEKHRLTRLKKLSFSYLKKLKTNNKKYYRGFELLGTFINSQKVSIFNIINLPNPQAYYTSHRYTTLLKASKFLYNSNLSCMCKAFKHWKLEIMYIKLLKFSVVINRKFILNQLSSFQTLNSGTN